MSGPTHGYADDVIRSALAASSGGLNLDAAHCAIQDALEAMQKQASALKEASYDGRSPEIIARAFNHTGKTADELFRLLEFAKGQPDSRPDLGTDWLRALTDEQLKTVARWVDENLREQEAEVGE